MTWRNDKTPYFATINSGEEVLGMKNRTDYETSCYIDGHNTLAGILHVNDICYIDFDRKDIFVKGKCKKISPKNMLLLETLILRSPSIVNYETLFMVYYGENYYTVDKTDMQVLRNFKTAIDKFITISGQPIYKVSVIETAVSNYYKKTIDDNNYGYLGGLKYYCIEVYKDVDGKTKTYGIRYVDMIKKNKKLYQKQESLPADYSEHMTYLFPNDYIKVYNGKNELKFEGFYKSVFNINQSKFYYSLKNTPTIKKKAFGISGKDTVKKYNINLLGKLGGEIKCSEPWSLILEKK